MFFDVHAHVYRYQYPVPGGNDLFISPDELENRHKELNIFGAVLLPIVSPEVYVPQSVGEIIELADNSNGKWVAFCNVDPRVYTNTSDAPIGHLLEHYKKLGCRGLGEFMPNLSFDDARVQNLLACAQRAKLPLLIDLTGNKNRGYGLYDDPGLPMLEACLEKYPDLTIIGHGPAFWAEISTLKNPGDRHGYPSYPVYEEGAVPRLMRTYDNLWADLSAGSGGNAVKRDRAYGTKFLNEFASKLMFGTDICSAKDEFTTGDYLISLRDLGELGEENFIKIARGNALRLLELDRSQFD